MCVCVYGVTRAALIQNTTLPLARLQCPGVHRAAGNKPGPAKGTADQPPRCKEGKSMRGGGGTSALPVNNNNNDQKNNNNKIEVRNQAVLEFGCHMMLYPCAVGKIKSTEPSHDGVSESWSQPLQSPYCANKNHCDDEHYCQSQRFAHQAPRAPLSWTLKSGSCNNRNKVSR